MDSLGKGIDTYVHLKKDKKWKIEAFRALAMTGFLEQALSEMENMTEEQVENLIREDKETFKSKEEFYLELENLKLTLALDDEIIEHFENNRNKFEQLKNELQNIKTDPKEESYKKINFKEHVKTDYKKLLISNISTSFNCQNCFEFLIGGMVDNTVGYLFIPNEEDVPEMNPSRIIMIRKIDNGWYLFKTT